jgi:hypothetical protein
VSGGPLAAFAGASAGAGYAFGGPDGDGPYLEGEPLMGVRRGFGGFQISAAAGPQVGAYPEGVITRVRAVLIVTPRRP